MKKTHSIPSSKEVKYHLENSRQRVMVESSLLQQILKIFKVLSTPDLFEDKNTKKNKNKNFISNQASGDFATVEKYI